MIKVTLTITGAEWGALRDVAENAFPNELFCLGRDHRRFALAGIEGTKRLTDEGVKQQAHELRSSEQCNGSVEAGCWPGVLMGISPGSTNVG